MSGPNEINAARARFAADLKGLFIRSGKKSLRQLAREVHFSHTTIAEAVGGKQLPTPEVLRAFVLACGEDPEPWIRRLHELNQMVATSETVEVVPSSPATAASPWPMVPLADGADPEEAGCSKDAITIHARRIALRGERRIIGVVELRYSPSGHAAWGRFKGYPLLDHLAAVEHAANVIVDVVRERDGRRGPFAQQYSFDYHWGDIVVTDEGLYYACATIEFDGKVVAYAETDRVALE